MYKKPITDIELLEHLDALPGDGREVFLLERGNLRVTAVQGTHMINQMRANHGLGILESMVLGQAYIASGLLSATVKGNDRVLLTVECGGPIGGIYTEAWANGNVRGYLKNVPIHVEKPLEDNDLTFLYGPGFITITKMIEGSSQPFSGQVMMQYGDLAKDLAVYYQMSEQTPSLFVLSIKFDSHGRIFGAGGFFLQVMPGCPDSIPEKLDSHISGLSSLGRHLAQGGTIRQYVEQEFAPFHPEHLDTLPVAFSCPCSRENFNGYLSSLPEQEKQSIMQDGPFPLHLDCLNCSTAYDFTKEELESIFHVS
ncbi:Hsp33 family molecular chaperone HslO [Parasphaerochaeta coccoides]|uniref:Hsp33 protein n=1 Tax=Parasphaerochaeta coccoides (strain ATCC BAA-1237 / DSM 17374 / SPN1) TaxID=760011 RepID=F4GHH5_PARC1|nr:Hsp33 family molecular chaperone HslO [Parasphaerochaeta coccoides]AEC02564.1 Hsp33 protein [Parasphaerochaeta coccoides DSM 17374]